MQLTSEFADLKKHLYSENGQLRNFVNVYLNDEDIRYLEKDGDAGRGRRHDHDRAGDRRRDGEPAEEVDALARTEIRRYSRHLIMPEVAMEGQKKLKAASVLLIGAGGLGSPLGLYLAAAGVGTHRHRRFRRGGRHATCSAR